jgi:hypothetical protein
VPSPGGNGAARERNRSIFSGPAESSDEMYVVSSRSNAINSTNECGDAGSSLALPGAPCCGDIGQEDSNLRSVRSFDFNLGLKFSENGT